MKTNNIFKVLLVLSILTSCLPFAFAGMSIEVQPFINETAQINKTFTYQFNITTNALCTDVVKSVTTNITTDFRGIAFYEMDIGGVDRQIKQPKYLCEVRNNSLRKVHNLTDILFTSIKTENITSQRYFLKNGSDEGLVFTDFNTKWAFKYDYLTGGVSVYNNSGMRFSTSQNQIEIVVANTTRIGLDPTGKLKYYDGTGLETNTINAVNGAWAFRSDLGLGLQDLLTFDGSAWNIQDTLGSLSAYFSDVAISFYKDLNMNANINMLDGIIDFGATNHWRLTTGDQENLTFSGGAGGNRTLFNQNVTLGEGWFFKLNRTEIDDFSDLELVNGVGFTNYIMAQNNFTTTLVTTYTTIANLTMRAGKNISIECDLMVWSVGATTGVQFITNFTGSTRLNIMNEHYTSTTAQALCNSMTANSACSPLSSSGTVVSPVRIRGWADQGTQGTFHIGFRSETGGNEVQVLGGSYCRTIERRGTTGFNGLY